MTNTREFCQLALATALVLIGGAANAAAPGIKTSSLVDDVLNFALRAEENYITQPDAIRSLVGLRLQRHDGGLVRACAAECRNADDADPGHMIVTEGVPFSGDAHQRLPVRREIRRSSSRACGSRNERWKRGLLTREAASGSSVTYTLVPTQPAPVLLRARRATCRSSGLYGAIIVCPPRFPANCNSALPRRTWRPWRRTA